MEPIQNRAISRSVLFEAVLCEALLYFVPNYNIKKIDMKLHNLHTNIVVGDADQLVVVCDKNTKCV